MSKYSPNSVWALVPGYNTARGQILDGICVSQTPSVSWEKGAKHSVEDGSTHHQIIKYLEAQPMKRARIADIDAAVPRRAPLEHYLREMEKQHICRQHMDQA
jgi:hypothetical protein